MKVEQDCCWVSMDVPGSRRIEVNRGAEKRWNAGPKKLIVGSLSRKPITDSRPEIWIEAKADEGSCSRKGSGWEIALVDKENVA